MKLAISGKGQGNVGTPWYPRLKPRLGICRERAGPVSSNYG
ncbi:MAG TPA: hypothetical protein VFH97_04160 [Gemmatimonadales bacterium]|nr:hypothetical protein [Gemmatimonadales bacterium]